jgi:uncharacterized membrane protein YtjA (UPF0391 family)
LLLLWRDFRLITFSSRPGAALAYENANQRGCDRRVPRRNHCLDLPLKLRSGANAARRNQAEAFMFGWAITFLIVALVAAVLGFGGIAVFAVDIARIIFFVAIVLFLISAVVGLVRGRAPRAP